MHRTVSILDGQTPLHADGRNGLVEIAVRTASRSAGYLLLLAALLGIAQFVF